MMELCTYEVKYMQHGCIVFKTMSNLLSVSVWQQVNQQSKQTKYKWIEIQDAKVIGYLG